MLPCFRLSAYECADIKRKLVVEVLEIQRSLSPPRVVFRPAKNSPSILHATKKTLGMSTAAKLTLAGTSIGAVGIIVLVHYQQNWEKVVSVPSTLTFPAPKAYDLQAMHAGVIRDIEQQRVKKERQADFEMQRALEEEYRKVQHVHDGDGGPGKARGSG